MTTSKTTAVGIAISFLLMIGSVLIAENFTHLGETYWDLIWSLAIFHLGISIVVLTFSPRKNVLGGVLMTLFIAGQWRATANDQKPWTIGDECGCPN